MDGTLYEAFDEVMGSFTPVPPPLKLQVDDKAPTFAVNLSQMLVKAPRYWNELEHVKELIGHELKHAAGDGLPYTYRNALMHEARIMKDLDIDVRTAKGILNIVYDVVVDLRVAKEGLDAKGMCMEWLDRFPVNPQAEGSSYHLLQIVYKDLFGTQLKETEYEKQLRQTADFENLKDIMKELASGTENNDAQTTELVAVAAALVAKLSRTEPPQNDLQNGRQSGDVDFDRGDPDVRADAAEIGLDAGLSNQQLAELMNVDEDELDRALREAAEDKVRTALWTKLLGFKGIFSNKFKLEIKEPMRQRWKPYSKRLDPSSTIKSPDDPRKWREEYAETVLTVEQEGESGGFTKLIVLIDCSGSTIASYGNKAVLGYIKDAAYSLIAYAKQFSLPIASIAFSSNAWILARESKDYVEHARKIFMLKPLDSTNLESAVQLTARLKPEKALVALLTDGFVSQQDLQRLAEQTQANKVVAAVVSVETCGVKNLEAVRDRVQLFIVKPDEAGKTIISALP